MELEFGDLPHEVVTLILRYIDTSIHIAKDVCRLWRELCLSQYVLRNIGSLIGIEYYQCLKTIDVGAAVLSLLCTPRNIISGDANAELCIWTLDGNYVDSFYGHSGSVTSLYSIDDNIIVSGSEDCTARVWDLNSRECKAVLENIHSICVIDKFIIGTNNTSGFIEIWNYNEAKKINELKDDGDWTISVWNRDHRLVTCDINGTITIWDPIEDRTHILSGHLGQIECIHYEPNLIITGGIDCTIRVWEYLTSENEVKKWVCTKVLEGHLDWVNKVNLIGDKIISASDDFTAKVWDLNTGSLLRTLDEHTDFVQAIEYSSLDGRIITGSYDSTIRIWGFEK